MSGHMFGRHNLGMAVLLTSSEQRQRVLSNALHPQDGPTAKDYLATNVNSPKVENWLRKTHTRAFKKQRKHVHGLH